MQSEISETLQQELSGPNQSLLSTPSSQHGTQHDAFATPSLSYSEERGGGLHDTGSEWSLSTESSLSEEELGLNAVEPFLSRRALFEDEDLAISVINEADETKWLDQVSKALITKTGRSPAIQACSQEVLLHVISHLPPTDLLNVKLVSRRFYDLANSPYAWISAFSRHFPGPSTVRTANTSTAEQNVLLTERRAFARLSPVASWTSEYLLRTKLLRCLERGRPSQPFAAPSQGKPHKGFATLSFHSRLRVVTHLDAKFGVVHDKRLPLFIHGSSPDGHVSISDRRGELVGWGLTHNHFRTFEDVYPGASMWGAGNGEIVGLPNVMDLSSSNGMIYGEGLPGGLAYFISNNEKYGRVLAPFMGIGNLEIGVPRIINNNTTVCSVWISQSLGLSRQTHGLVGMLTGSSCGVVSAHSLGVMDRGERITKGELTARWVLSPGVPIIALKADQNFTADRADAGRVWAVALNALGEIFYIRNIPVRAQALHSAGTDPDVLLEMRSWKTGKSAQWRIIPSSQRHHRPSYEDETRPPAYLPQSTWLEFRASEDSRAEYNSVQLWLTKTPSEIQAKFNSWDMRQRLEVDFAADDGNHAGEAIFVFRCGYEDDVDGAYRELNGMRYVRQTELREEAGMASEKISKWRSSNIVFGLSKHFKITTTAIDSSKFAVTTVTEDLALWHARLAEQDSDKKTKSLDSIKVSTAPKIPGQRARILAAGTSTGHIFLWNARVATSTFASITNEISPLRIISTTSPSISSLALTSLYLVHGGSEGLVQAWDPLGSTEEPVRTICSALSRRALLAAQQDQNHHSRNYGAVSAICLDPDPTLLRGIVAMRDSLRYWSYSSSAAVLNVTRARKRRMQRSSRGAKSSPSEGYTGVRRVDLKEFVSQEMAARSIDEQERRAEEKNSKRLNGRFGVDLLGSDASEEELIAYAKLLSEEEQEKQMQKAMEKRLDRNASEDEVRAHIGGLSLEDFEKWKYASWEERFAMPASNSGSVTRQTASPLSTPRQPDPEGDADLVKAMQLSLDEQTNPDLFPLQSSSGHPTLDSYNDSDISDAIRESLKQADSGRSTQSLGLKENTEDDLAKAIRLSLQDQNASQSTPSATGEGVPGSGSWNDEIEYPALGSSPTAVPSISGWAKGKRKATK